MGEEDKMVWRKVIEDGVEEGRGRKREREDPSKCLYIDVEDDVEGGC